MIAQVLPYVPFAVFGISTPFRDSSTDVLLEGTKQMMFIDA